MDPNQPNVTVALVKGDADRATEAMLLESVPTLRAMTDEAMAAALADLYHCGAEAGAERANGVMKELVGWLARLVAAHQRNDVGEVVVILDEFIAERCVITGGPTPTVPH